MKKSRIYNLIILSWTCLVLQAQDTYVIDKVVARVGGEIVLLSDVEEQYAYLQGQSVALDENAKCDILETTIAQKMIIHHAKVDSVEVGDDEVDAQLNYRFDNILAQMNGDEDFFKEYYGATVPEMKEKFRDDQKQQILMERMQQSLIAKVDITPKEVLEFYESIPLDSLPYLNSEVEISELIIEPKVNDVERQKALDKITEIRNKIVDQGEVFEDLAKIYSMDGSAANGGDLGFAKRGSYVADFEAAAYSLVKDELSEVVESEFGFHIIKLVERRGNRIHVKHILIKPEITYEDLELAKTKLTDIIAEIRRDSLEFGDGVRRYSLEASPSYSNGGRMKNQQNGTTFFETGDLPPDVYFAIDTLEIEEITDPIEYNTPSGETLYRTIKLTSRSNPHRASLDQDYDRIKQIAKESKKNVYMAEWIESKYSKTYIEVEGAYGSCPNLMKWSKDVVNRP